MGRGSYHIVRKRVRLEIELNASSLKLLNPLKHRTYRRSTNKSGAKKQKGLNPFSTIGTVWKEPSKPGSSCPYGDNKNSGTMKLGQMFYCIYLKTQPFYPEGCLAQTTHKKKLNHQYKFVNEHPPS